MDDSKKLKGKDLINIGIFLAIDFIIVMAIAMTGFIPVMIPMLSILCPLIGAIPYMLFLTKVKKFGMISIFGFLMGVLLMICGMGFWPVVISIFTGVGADLIYTKAGKCSSKKFAVLSSGVFFILMWSNELPLFLDMEKYFSTRSNFSQDYVDSLTRLMPAWMNPVLFVCSFVFGILGGLIGMAMCKKHFAKAGIA